jgi:hypothetical protein
MRWLIMRHGGREPSTFSISNHQPSSLYIEMNIEGERRRFLYKPSFGPTLLLSKRLANISN